MRLRPHGRTAQHGDEADERHGDEQSARDECRLLRGRHLRDLRVERGTYKGVESRVPRKIGHHRRGDAGYRGPRYDGIEGITTETRRPPGRTPTDRQKSANQSLAGIRSVVEQTIAHLKNWKILKHYRGPVDRFERALNCVEALYNLEHSHRRHSAPNNAPGPCWL